MSDGKSVTVAPFLEIDPELKVNVSLTSRFQGVSQTKLCLRQGTVASDHIGIVGLTYFIAARVQLPHNRLRWPRESLTAVQLVMTDMHDHSFHKHGVRRAALPSEALRHGMIMSQS